MIEQFNKKQLEAALPVHNHTGEKLWKEPLFGLP
jgi:hypothetical protein